MDNPPAPSSPSNARWTAQRAWDWYRARPWIVGCNFIPSTAINQLEMWQAETFDPATIDRELALAQSIGMNSVRTYLHDLAFDADPGGFLERIDTFLGLAAARGITPLLVFFDDCWNADGAIGPQPVPKPGIHNSGWLQSPLARHRVPGELPRLEHYIKTVIARFAHDKRVLLWDLYNETGNGTNVALAGDRVSSEGSVTLLKCVFDWARATNPTQPLTSGMWYDFPHINAVLMERSDVITFHNYENPDHLAGQILGLRGAGRPVICTEWMARKPGSTVYGCLPVFKKRGVGCFNWGLVDGKTNTIHAWNDPRPDAEPEIWFHDLFRRNGTPYRESETAMFRGMVDEARREAARSR